MKYVIIGAGIAGAQAAKTIREKDNSGEIVMISTDRASKQARGGLGINYL